MVRGKGLGRRLGIPTANLSVPPSRGLPLGVFRVSVSGTGLNAVPAVCNVGFRPTVSGERRRSVEVHIPGFDGNLYGRTLRVSFLRRIRPERRFKSLAALKAQIRRDIRTLWAQPGGVPGPWR